MARLHYTLIDRGAERDLRSEHRATTGGAKKYQRYVYTSSVYVQESPGWIFLFKLVIFFWLKISNNLNLFSKIDWSMNSGRRRAGDS